MTDYITKLLEDTLVVDTETTSLDFREAEVIQYASDSALKVLETIALEEFEVSNDFYKPAKPISAKISSITTITNRMVADCIDFKTTLDDVQKEFDEYKYMVAHNAYYDDRIFKEHDLKTPENLCTLRLSRKLLADDPSIEEHTLSYLRYALDLPIPDDIPAHLADADVMVTALLLAHLIGLALEQGVINDDSDYGEQLIEYLASPVVMTIMPFGKHKGKKLTEVPISYWQWAMDKMDSLNEADPAYDKDFAASVSAAVEAILEKNAS